MRNLRTDQVSVSFTDDRHLDRIKLLAWQLADSHQITNALSLLEVNFDRSRSPSALLEYVRLLAAFDSPRKALDKLESNFDFLTHHASAIELCSIYNAAATLARQVDNQSCARLYQQQAIRHDLRSSKDGVLQRQTLLGQACDLIKLNEVSAAKFLLISLKDGTDTTALFAKVHLAEIYLEEAEFSAAELMLDEAISICDETSNDSVHVQVLRLLSRVSTGNKNYATAKRFLNQALSLAKSSARCRNTISSIETECHQLKQLMMVACQVPEWN